MDGNSGELAAPHIDLSRVQARADLEAHFADRVRDCGGAENRPRRAIEGDDDAVPGCVDEAAPELIERVVDHVVMTIK